MTDQNSGAVDMRAKILQTLNKGGYALEMRVAAKARQRGAFFVTQSRYYTDPETGKYREIDVVPYWVTETNSHPWVHVSLAVECKSYANPWIIFDTGNPALPDLATNLSLAISTVLPAVGSKESGAIAKLKEKMENALPRMGDANCLFASTEFGTGNGIVQISWNAKPDEKPAGTDKAWLAVQGAVAAARGLRADMGAHALQDSGGSQAWVFFWIPVVVTSGPLYRSWLNEDDEIDLAEIDCGSVRIRFDTDAYARCLVVTERGMEKLLTDATATVKLLN